MACSHGFTIQCGTSAGLAICSMVTANTGNVSTAPTITSFVSALISLARSVASRRSASAASTTGAPTRKSGGETPSASAEPSARGRSPSLSAPSLLSSPSTLNNPCTIFMPHANGYSPAGNAGSSTSVVALPGSMASSPRSANTTCEVHSPVSCRSKVSVIGVPVRMLITAGEYPPLTVIVADWRSPEASMAPAVAFCVPKKNRSTSHVNAAAAISAVAAEKMPSSITVPSPCLLY